MNNKIIWFFFFLSFTDDVDGDDDGILEIFKSSRESFGGGNKESGKYDNFRWLIIFKRELTVMISEILATFVYPNTENNFAKIRSGKWHFWWHVCALEGCKNVHLCLILFYLFFSSCHFPFMIRICLGKWKHDAGSRRPFHSMPDRPSSLVSPAPLLV